MIIADQFQYFEQMKMI